MEKTIKTIIGILVIVALSLGYFILKQMNPSPTQIEPLRTPLAHVSSSPMETPVGTTLPMPLPTKGTPTPTPPAIPMATPSLTSDQQLVLKPPPSGSQKEAIGAYFNAVQKLAVDAKTIEIGQGCFANPIVVRAKQGSQLTIINKDSRDHELNFDGPSKVGLVAGHSATISINFSHGPGLYAYTCDPSSPTGKIVGVLTVQ